jgi:hypothetical protein
VTGTYPASGASHVFQDVVVKAFLSRPVADVTSEMFTLTDSRGARVPASVAQIGDGTWALFPDAVFLHAGGTYTARLRRGVCAADGGCTKADAVWRFTVASDRAAATGDTTIPLDFGVSTTGRRR